MHFNAKRSDIIMLSIFDIEDFINEFLRQNNIQVSTKIDYNILHLLAYNRSDNLLKINSNTKLFYNNAKALNMRIKDFLICAIAHEIGHYLDSEVMGRLSREYNAYKNGLQYIPSRLKDKYIQLNEINLNKYKDTKKD
jgi:hypothetical protein